MELRQQVAEIMGHLPGSAGTSNNEEGAYPCYPFQANYSKALKKQAQRSDPDEAAYSEYLQILDRARRREASDFEEIELGGRYDVEGCKCDERARPRRLTNPQGGLPFSLLGSDPSGPNLNLFRSPARSLRPVPRIDRLGTSDLSIANENASEMVELYWMSLVRDLPFVRWNAPDPNQRVLMGAPQGWAAIENSANPLINRAVADLDLLKGNFAEAYPPEGGAVTNDNVFRGAAYGDRFGPYISQFLLRGNTTRCQRGTKVRDRPEDGVIPEGAVPNLQKQSTVESYVDYLRKECEWRCVEQGVDDPSGTDAVLCKADNDDGTRFIRNLRDLGQRVHVDDPAQHYRNAAFLLANEPELEKDPPQAENVTVGLNVGQRPLDFSGTIALDGGRAADPCRPQGQPFPFSLCNPYRKDPNDSDRNPDAANQSGFVTFGLPFVLDLIGVAAQDALAAAWWQKWFVHRRNRPEEFGGLVHYQKSAVAAGNKGPYPCVDRVILDRDVLRLIKLRNAISDPVSGLEAVPGGDTYLLPQAFPEGSPTHPAYPSGHATISGACATLLKAMFDERARMTCSDNTVPTDPTKLPVAFVAAEDGKRLQKAPEQEALRVGPELDKLASNVSVGRNAAGVHWRSDATQGMALGEAVAAELLFETAFTLEEEEFCFTFRRFFENERVWIVRTTETDEEGRNGTQRRNVRVFIQPIEGDESDDPRLPNDLEPQVDESVYLSVEE